MSIFLNVRFWIGYCEAMMELESKGQQKNSNLKNDSAIAGWPLVCKILYNLFLDIALSFYVPPSSLCSSDFGQWRPPFHSRPRLKPPHRPRPPYLKIFSNYTTFSLVSIAEIQRIAPQYSFQRSTSMLDRQLVKERVNLYWTTRSII